MAKVNQIIAIEKGIKSRIAQGMARTMEVLGREELFNGFSKDYRKLDEAGEDLPSESRKVQFTVDEIFEETSKNLKELFRVTARKEWSNTEARSDIIIDGAVMLKDVPVSYLLFLEKQAEQLKSLIGRAPILDPADYWKLDSNSNYFVTDVVRTHRTRKTEVPIVLYDATDKHPAQTQLITKDVLAGHWEVVKKSGALTKGKRKEYLERVEKLLQAVQEARERANSSEEIDCGSPEDILEYVFRAS